MNKYNFKLKGTGENEYHLGMSFCRNDRNELYISPQWYIEKMVDNYKGTLWRISFALFTISFGIKRSSRNQLLQVSQ
jgi:hypothetical protein